jgi:hypothetical protein
MSQQQQLMHQSMNMLGNQGMGVQMPRQTPRMSHTPVNMQTQYHPQQPGSFPQNNMLTNINTNATLPNAAAAHLLNMNANRPPQGLLNAQANINPGVARQFQNLNKGIAMNPSIAQRPSISQQPPNNLVQNLQQARQNFNQYEQALATVKTQVNAVAASRNIQQLQSIRASLLETQKKCQMERERWASLLTNLRSQQRDGMEAFIKAIEETVGRAQQLCTQYETFGLRLEDALHTLQQQQQQPPPQQQQPQNQMLKYVSILDP